VEVECLPGATAFVPALAVSGLPNERFCFEGFLPPKKGRQTRLQALAAEERSVVLYESPFRLLKTLAQLSEVCGGERQVSISREISKRYEETRRGTLDAMIAHFSAYPPKGEFVIVIAGANKERTNNVTD
jgi:16S rRNA (cytidine1402-2'-O)-methyltransferase